MIGLAATGFATPNSTSLTHDAWLAATGFATPNSTSLTHDAWALRFNKRYTSPAKRAAAAATFAENDRLIADHNAKGLSYTLAHNEYSDLSVEAFRGEPMLERVRAPLSTDATLSSTAVADPPASVDWVTAGKVTSVKNQDRCGGCWAFATAAAVESALAIARGSTPVSFSVEQLVSCDTIDKGCQGGNAQNAFRWIEEGHPLCLDSEWPFSSGDGTTPACHSCKPEVDVGSHVVMPRLDEDAIKAAVALGPVSVSIAAYSNEFQLYHSGVFSSATCGVHLDHAVTIVGYGHDADAALDYWTIKNSWGDSWGAAGYMRIARGVNMCGIALEAAQPRGVASLTRPIPPFPPSPPTSPPTPPSPPSPEKATRRAALSSAAASVSLLSALCSLWLLVDLALGGLRSVGGGALVLHLAFAALLSALAALAYAAPPFVEVVTHAARGGETLRHLCSCDAPDETAGACVAQGVVVLGAQWASAMWLLATAAALLARGPARGLARSCAASLRAVICWGVPIVAAACVSRDGGGSAPWPKEDWCVVAGGAVTLGWLGTAAEPAENATTVAVVDDVGDDAGGDDSGLGLAVPWRDVAAMEAIELFYVPMVAAAALGLLAALVSASCCAGRRRRAAAAKLHAAADGAAREADAEDEDAGIATSADAALERAFLLEPSARRLLRLYAFIWAAPLTTVALRWRGVAGDAASTDDSSVEVMRIAAAVGAGLVGFALQLTYLCLGRRQDLMVPARSSTLPYDQRGGVGGGGGGAVRPGRRVGGAACNAALLAHDAEAARREEEAVAQALALSQADEEQRQAAAAAAEPDALGPLPPQWQAQAQAPAQQ